MIDNPEVLGIIASLTPPQKLEDQREALNSAYNYLMATEKFQPIEGMFRRIAYSRYQWSVTEFENWSKGKTWVTR